MTYKPAIAYFLFHVQFPVVIVYLIRRMDIYTVQATLVPHLLFCPASM